MITQETALRIVKQAEEQYSPEIHQGLAHLIGCITGWFYHENLDGDEGSNAWQQYHDGAESMMIKFSDDIAKELVWKVKHVVDLLNIAHDQEKKLHAVIMAYRALKEDIKKCAELCK